MVTHSICSQKMPGSEILVHNATNDDTGMFDITDMDMLVQGSSGIMPAMKKSKYEATYNKSMGLNGSTLYGP